MRFLLEKYRLQIGVFLVTVVVVGGGVLAFLNARSSSLEVQEVEKLSPDQSRQSTASATPSLPLKKIKVDVAGAVVSPGVCELFEDSRVEDALDAAGGFSGGADQGWVSKNLNLAAKLSDGDKIYIPEVGETPTQTSAAGEPASSLVPPSVGQVSGTESSNCSRVNINNASAGTLDDCLSGIGPAYAKRIIEYREAHGGFKAIEEIQEVRGIGPKTFEKIKDQISVD